MARYDGNAEHNTQQLGQGPRFNSTDITFVIRYLFKHAVSSYRIFTAVIIFVVNCLEQG
jgi:hypothetical protein